MNIRETHRRFRRYCAIEEGLSITTLQSMKVIIGTFLKRTGIENIEEMTIRVLKEFFYEGKEKYQWSYYNYCNYHKYLKKFLNWCVAEKHLKNNPILEIKIPKKPQNLPRRLTQTEAQKILYTSFSHEWFYEFERPRNHAIIATFLFAGIRAKELRNLYMMDVDLNNGTIFIRAGKGNKDRYIPIHYKLKSTLQLYIDQRKKAGKKSLYLFTGAQSNLPLAYKSIAKICQKISISGGVKFTPHQLRHTFGSVSIEQGIGLVQLKEIMGHSNIHSTMIYLRMSPKGLRDSLNKLEMF